MASLWMVVLALALSHCQGQASPDTEVTSQLFKREVTASFGSNGKDKKVKFQCDIFLVHNDKTVFLESQDFMQEMVAKERKGKGKAKPSNIEEDATAKPIRPIKPQPLLSNISCTPNYKISANADDFEIISKSKDPYTLTIFTLSISTDPDVIKKASIRHIKLMSGQDMFDQLELPSRIDKLENLTPKEKNELTEFMQKAVSHFAEHENAALLVKFKKTYIQFNAKTDQLGLNARLLAILEVFAKAFKEREIGKNRPGSDEKRKDVDQLIDGLSQDCQDSTNGFEGTDHSDVTCDPCDKYRRIDGVCNNLENKEFGAAAIAMRRLLPPAYHDNDGHSPRGGFQVNVSNGQVILQSDLPSPRKISVALHHSTPPSSNIQPPIPSPFFTTSSPLTSKGFTHMAMQFGQFMDHDITLSAEQELECCDKDFFKSDAFIPSDLRAYRRCFNIDIVKDPFYESRKIDCHSFTRSDFICTGNGVREQINGITAFIDASNVYGSDATRAAALRLNDGTGKLRENTAQTSGHLPTRAQCGLTDAGEPDDLVGGDVRANEQPTLASLHTLFLNEHNRIVDALKDEAINRGGSFLSGLSPSEQDDILYEEARKIVGATLQNIVYEEFLPIVLGSAQVAAQGLVISGTSVYDDQMDPSVLNEFATVAYRFGHSLIDGLFNIPLAPHKLRDNYFKNDDFSLDNEWKREMDGVIQQKCPAFDLIATYDVTNFLFQGHNNFPDGTMAGDDLIARNIQRGRDHGIPSYRKFREFCGLKDLDGKSHPLEISPTKWKNILTVYSSVDDIDAFTGGLAEEAPADGLVGPTFACIIGRQFKRLMSGDRFFFTHTTGSDHVRGLLPKSKETVRKRTLGDVICDNANEGVHALTTPPALHVMKQVSKSNPQIKCKERDPLDISGIVDDIEDFDPCGTENFQPLPGFCATKSSEIVDYDQEWDDGCLDLKGNKYAKDQFLMSCCGCFKIICNSTQPLAHSRQISDNIFFWNKTVEPQCCQDCHGKVFTAGTIMDTEVLKDSCSTTVATKCVFVGQENRAIAEMSYTYRNCCSDDTGLHPIGTTIQVPETCSKRTCDREDGQIHSAWITKQVVSGCNCCPLPPICSEPKVTCSVEEGNLVEDGGVLVVNPGKIHLKCCQGKFLEENLSFGK